MAGNLPAKQGAISLCQAFPEALRILCPRSGKVRFMLLEYDRVSFLGAV